MYGLPAPADARGMAAYDPRRSAPARVRRVALLSHDEVPMPYPVLLRLPAAGALLIAALAAPASHAQTTDSLTWTHLANDGQAFSVSGTRTVRYGTGVYWLTKSVSGSGTCNAAFFSGDPAYGSAKTCQVASASSTTTTVPVAAAVCTAPITAAATSSVAPSVGNGTPQSCTESALRSAIASHSVVTFNCGSLPVTIPIAATIDLPVNRNLVIDGGRKVTLDGRGTTRIFSMVNPNYRTNRYGLTLQRITLANGRAPASGYVAPNPSNPSCAYGYAGGSGGAILVRDARLHVIDVTFRGNKAATPGPDVGGGAVYAQGALDVTIVGSTFTGNSGSNAGAVGLLQSNGRFVNSVFAGNIANGTGQNYAYGAASGCPGVGHPHQGGAGGNAGAIGADGSDDTDLMVCGSRFVDNRSNELAGALFRTANGVARRTTIDRSLFQGNRAKKGGALFLSNAKPLDIWASTFSANVATGGGAAQFVSSRLNVINSTFTANEATAGLGGAWMVGAMDATGSVRNATFSGNKSSAGPGYFSAAIAGTMNFPVYNTVFANNTTADAWNPMQCGFSAGTGAYNRQWPRNRVVGGALDSLCIAGIGFANPLLGALASNGGPTPTLAPASTSPLRGAGRNCPPTDQRGVARNTAACTIGAVE
jgi:predicted outer membrane repeat protein